MFRAWYTRFPCDFGLLVCTYSIVLHGILLLKRCDCWRCFDCNLRWCFVALCIEWCSLKISVPLRYCKVSIFVSTASGASNYVSIESSHSAGEQRTQSTLMEAVMNGGFQPFSCRWFHMWRLGSPHTVISYTNWRLTMSTIKIAFGKIQSWAARSNDTNVDSQQTGQNDSLILFLLNHILLIVLCCSVKLYIVAV